MTFSLSHQRSTIVPCRTTATSTTRQPPYAHPTRAGMFRRILAAGSERMFSAADSRKTTSSSIISANSEIAAAEDDEAYFDAYCHDSIFGKRSKISWGTVQIRTFPNIVGDNPEAKGAGPPVRNYDDIREIYNADRRVDAQTVSVANGSNQ